MSYPGGADHEMREETPAALPHPVTPPAINIQQLTRLIQIRYQALHQTIPGLSEGFQSLESHIKALGEAVQILHQTQDAQMREGGRSIDQNVCLPVLSYGTLRF